MKEESIRKLYAKLESKSDLEELPYKKIQDESLSEKERIVLQKEWWILSDYATRCDNVHNQEEIVTYAKERVASTSNIFLLARYNHVLYNLTKKGENCKAAITNYISIFKQYVFRNDKEIGYDAYLILNCIIQLSKRIRRDLSDVEELILTYLKSDDITDKIKQWILDSIKYNYKNWKLKGLEFVPELCIRMYSQAIDYGECKAISNTIDYSIPTLVEAGFIERPSAGIYTKPILNATIEIALAAYRESFFLNNPLLNRSNDYDGSPYFEFASYRIFKIYSVNKI